MSSSSESDREEVHSRSSKARGLGSPDSERQEGRRGDGKPGANPKYAEWLKRDQFVLSCLKARLSKAENRLFS